MEAPQRINDETYAIPTFFPAGPFGFLPINWYLIKAKEPILIDTGMIVERDDFVKTLGSLVDPKDIKWIFLTHDDHDHSGNLQEVMMELAPEARLVTNLLSVLRLGDTWEVPMNRIYAINPGQSFTAGDREFATVRPPIFDGPSSIALYDGKTETLFSVDSFGALIPAPAQDINDVPEQAFTEGFNLFNRIMSPWTAWVDQSKFDRVLEDVRRLGAKTILATHMAPAHGRTEDLIKATAAIPAMVPAVMPDQAAMEAMMAQMHGDHPPG